MSDMDYSDIARRELMNESTAGDLAEAKRQLEEAKIRLRQLRFEESSITSRMRMAKEAGKDISQYTFELGRLRSEIYNAQREVAKYQAQVDRYQAEYNEEHRPEIEAEAQRRRDHELAMQRQRDAVALEKQKQHDSNDAVNMRRQKRNSAIKGAVAGAVAGAGAKAAYDYYKKKRATNENVYFAVAEEQRSEE